MKRCSVCKRTFEDNLTFCLIDGTVLSAPFDLPSELGQGDREYPTEILPEIPNRIEELSVETKIIGAKAISDLKPSPNPSPKMGKYIFLSFIGLTVIAVVLLLSLNMIKPWLPQASVVETSNTNSTQKTQPETPTTKSTETTVPKTDENPLKTDKERALRIMSGFKIGIYYRSADDYHSKRAALIKKHLTEYGFGDVVLSPKNESFFTEIGQTYGDEVRYEAGSEDAQAETLTNILNEFFHNSVYEKFEKQPVTNKSEKFISIVLGREPKN